MTKDYIGGDGALEARPPSAPSLQVVARQLKTNFQSTPRNKRSRHAPKQAFKARPETSVKARPETSV